MRILLVMDPGILVPPKGYGGIERIVEMMAKEYLAAGHEVHLLATTGSYVEGCVMHPFGKEGYPQTTAQIIRAIPFAWKFLWKHRRYFNLVHNFGRLAYLLPLFGRPVQKIMSYQREISNRNMLLMRFFKVRNFYFTACSSDLMSRLKHKFGQWAYIYNAVEFSKYKLSETVAEDAPLVFLGRIEKVKGCHTAIQLARQTGHNLIIAGNISTLPEEVAYYESEIKPYIDGRQIQYVGTVNDEQKNYYLGIAKAMLFPIEWNEPFGIVMVEAMACGTPVIGYNKGSVEEVIDEGITGFKVNSTTEMAEAIYKLNTINRTACRQQAAKRFDAPAIATQYLKLFEPANGKKKILVATTNQPATNPRMMKEYEALREKGYDVKVVYAHSAEWAYSIDRQKFHREFFNTRDFIQAGGNPHTHSLLFMFSRVFFRACYLLARFAPIKKIEDWAISKSSFFIWKKLLQYKADLYIAHYTGALPGIARAAALHHAPFIFDAEDFHRGESEYYPKQNELIQKIENRYLPLAAHITAASPLIAEAYNKLYPQVPVTVINNVFSKKHLQPVRHEKNSGPLRLFWFSQNVGPNRGLEVVIEAINMLNAPVELYLLGNPKNPFYVHKLKNFVQPPASIHLLNPVDPDKVFSVAANYHIGLASEIPHCENRNICLTNKIFTYLLAGNCILASDTAAQKRLIDQYPAIGLLYRYNDARHLAEQIMLLHTNRQLLQQYRTNALQLAATTLNWEAERNKLYKIVEAVLPVEQKDKIMEKALV